MEGQFDVILAHKSGYTNTVAVSGTALSRQHVALLQRLSNRCVLALDADRAGINAVKKSAVTMLQKGMDVKVALMPDGQDPADIIVTDGADKFKNVIGQSKHVIEFLLDHLKDNGKDERSYKLEVCDNLLPLIHVMPNKVDQEHFVKLIAAALSVKSDVVSAELKRYTAKLQDDNKPPDVSTPVVPQSYRRLDQLFMYLTAVSRVSGGRTEDYFKQAGKRIEAELAEVGNCADPDEGQVLKFTFEFETLFDTQSHKNILDDIAHSLTELIHTSARKELTDKRNKISNLTSADGEETILGEIRKIQDRLLTTISFDT